MLNKSINDQHIVAARLAQSELGIGAQAAIKSICAENDDPKRAIYKKLKEKRNDGYLTEIAKLINPSEMISIFSPKADKAELLIKLVDIINKNESESLVFEATVLEAIQDIHDRLYLLHDFINGDIEAEYLKNQFYVPEE